MRAPHKSRANDIIYTLKGKGTYPTFLHALLYKDSPHNNRANVFAILLCELSGRALRSNARNSIILKIEHILSFATIVWTVDSLSLPIIKTWSKNFLLFCLFKSAIV